MTDHVQADIGAPQQVGAPAKPRQFFVLCSGPRTGSTYLCREMARREVFGQPGEFFNFFDTLFEYAEFLKPRDLPDYVDKLFQSYGAPTGLFGWKAFWLDFKFVQELSGQFERFQPLTYIYLDRTDRAAQAVSFAYASASSAWTSEDRAVDDLPYDKAAIDRCAEDLAFNREQWEQYFSANSITPLRLEYRDVTGNSEQTLARLAGQLGVTLPPAAAPEINSLQRQIETAKTRWLARYRDDTSAQQPRPAWLRESLLS